MNDISNLLANILSAVYGKDVRQSIHDAIKQCYIDHVTEPGYYTPSITDDLKVIFTASKPYMEQQQITTDSMKAAIESYIDEKIGEIENGTY